MVSRREFQTNKAVGTVQLDVAEQKPGDLELAINCDLSKGTLESRPGWKILRYVNLWDHSDSAGAVPSTAFSANAFNRPYRDICTSEHEPLGAHIHESPNGIKYILSVVRQYATGTHPYKNYLIVKTITAQPMAPNTGVTGGIGGSVEGSPLYDNTSENYIEDDGSPYVFESWGPWVYFSNGGSLWRWSEQTLTVEFMSDKFIHGTNDPQGSFPHYRVLTGANIIVRHLQHMVYAGFDNSYAELDQPADVTGDGVVDAKDLTHGVLTIKEEDNKEAVIRGSNILFSQRGIHWAVPHQGSQMVPSGNRVTGIASHNKRLVVFTETETYVLSGSPGNMSWVKISASVGCVSHRSIAESREGVLCWLAKDGVYAWVGNGRPVKISKAVDGLFKGEVYTSFPHTFNGLYPEDVNAPFHLRRNEMGKASATFVGTDQYYAIALSAGVSQEWNNVILCVTVQGKCWFYASRPSGLDIPWSTTGEVSGGVIPSQANATNTGAISSGHAALMSVSSEPDRLFSQCFSIRNPWGVASGVTVDSAICVMDGPGGDDRLVYSENESEEPVQTITNVPFSSLAISSRLFLSDSNNKRVDDVNIRLEASMTYAHIAAEQWKLMMAYIPELSPFDNFDASQTKSIETNMEVEPWPDQYSGKKYFFIDNQTVPYTNQYGVDIAFLSNGVFNKRVIVKNTGGRTQFYRIAFWHKVTEQSGRIMKIISWSPFIKIGFGRSK